MSDPPNRPWFGSRRTRLFAAGVGVLAALSIPAISIAGHQTAGVDQYTGCLNTTSGTFTSIAQGDAPKTACGDKQIQVHLSGGDMTAVDTPSNGGLQGGSNNGAASVGLQDSYKLPQTCADGEIAKWSPTSSRWGCATDSDSGGDITAVQTPAGGGLNGGAETGAASLGLLAGFKLPQGCANGEVPKWNPTSALWACASDQGGTYDGTDFAKSNTACPIWYQSMTGVSASGDPVCGSTEGTRWDTERCFDDVELSPAQNGWTTLCTIALSKSHELAHTQQWAVSAVIQLRNSADLALQDNTRTVKCEIGHPETGDSFSRNRVSLLGHEGYGTLHMLDDKSATTAAVRCNVERSGNDRSYVYSEKVTILARDLGPICGGAPLDCPR